MTPKAINLPPSKIAAVAMSLYEQLKLQPASDLKKVVEMIGGEVRGRGAARSGEKALIVRGERFTIQLAHCCGPFKDRFDIAHNIGHFALHYLYRKDVFGEDIEYMEAPMYGVDPADREANTFARTFLMPAEQYTRAYHAASGNHTLLSYQFEVTQLASSVRAQSLGLEAPEVRQCYARPQLATIH